jgi:MoxR-like ATPase
LHEPAFFTRHACHRAGFLVAYTCMSNSPLPQDDVAAIDELRKVYVQLSTELKKIIVGQDKVVEQLAICLFARGHALLMGVPGLAKTLLISRLAETMSLSFSRIQFTPDLMPMDITGTDILQELPGGKRAFEFAKGPVFANIVLADEINRAPAKTQAAMLEAMQEHKVTVAGRTYTLDSAVLRPRHAEPHRAGRHLSASRSPARPLHVHDRRRLPEPR